MKAVDKSPERKKRIKGLWHRESKCFFESKSCCTLHFMAFDDMFCIFMQLLLFFQMKQSNKYEMLPNGRLVCLFNAVKIVRLPNEF